jgi:hypothetical protein
MYPVLIQTVRHPLTCYVMEDSELPLHEPIETPIDDCENLYLLKVYRELIQVKLDTSFSSAGNARNILLMQTNQPRIVCTTSVFSFGTRILETREIGYISSNNAVQFSFVPKFFSAFFKGFHLLSAEQGRLAIENLSIVQSFSNDQKKLQSVIYQFSLGEGTAEMFRLSQ